MLWLALSAIVLACAKADDVQAVYECDFETDECGFANLLFQAKWERQEINLAGRTGHAMVLKANGKEKQIGRMRSPYFALHRDVKACFSFDGYISGPGAEFASLVLQDIEGFERLASATTTDGQWKHYALPAMVSEFAEVLYEGHLAPAKGEGIIAVDNFKFKLNGCD